MHLRVDAPVILTIGIPGHVIQGRNGYTGEIEYPIGSFSDDPP